MKKFESFIYFALFAVVAGTSDVADSFMQTFFWSDATCSIYAGVFGQGLNACLYSANAPGVSINQYSLATPTLLENGNYILNVTYYSSLDPTCTSIIAFDVSELSPDCTATGGGYFITSASIVDTVPTTFPQSGSMSKMYPSFQNCTDNVAVMSYQFMTYNSGVCFPAYNGGFFSPTSCTSGLSGSSTTSCNSAVDGISNEGLCMQAYYSTAYEYRGNEQYYCYGEGNNSNNDLSAGAIGDIVAAVLVVVFGVSAALYWFVIRKKADPPLLEGKSTVF